MSYFGYLAELLMAECEERDQRRSARRIKAAGFPYRLAQTRAQANAAVKQASG
jgi:hypothetical protein